MDGLTLDATNESAVSCFDFELVAPLIRAVVVQDLMTTKEFSELTLSPPLQSTDPLTRVASIMQFQVEQTHFLLKRNLRQSDVLHRQETFGRMSVNRSIFRLAVASPTPTTKRRSMGNLDVTSEVTVTGLRVLLAGGKTDVGIERMATRLNHLAPGNTFAVALELSNAAKVLASFIQKTKDDGQMSTQRTLHAILVVDGRRPSADVLSAVQPSFFVQAGRPKELRHDVNWKLLFHLRRTLASMSQEERQQLESQTSLPISTPMMSEKLRSQRVPWITEAEGPTVLDVPLFHSLFEPTKHRELNLATPPGPQFSFSFQLTFLEFSYEDVEASIQNTISISDIGLQLDCLSRGVLAPLNSVPPKAIRADAMYSAVTVITGLGVHSIQVAIYPTFILFLRNTIHAWKTLVLKAKRTSLPEEQKFASFYKLFRDRLVVSELRLSLHKFLFEAAAENLIFEVASKDCSSSTLLQVSKPNHDNEHAFDITGNHTFGFDEISLKARARHGADPKNNRDDTLAAVNLSYASFCAIFQNHTPRGPVLRSTFHMKKIALGVPRSAIRLYHFFEQWRQDYLLGIESMLHSLFSEIRAKPGREKPQVPKQRPLSTFVDFHASIAEIAIDLRVMHNTWLSWSAEDIVTYLKGVPNLAKNLEYGLQITSQRVKITSVTSTIDEGKGLPKPTIELLLPSLRTTGSYSSSHIDLIVLVGTFNIMIKPSHWDSLLSVQQKFGQDFNDLLVLFSDTKRRHTLSESRTDRKMDHRTPFHVTARSEGFMVGLEGVASTQYLECFDIDAIISDAGVRRWVLTFKNVALYLSPKSSEFKPNAIYPLRVNVDFEASSSLSTPNSKGSMELSVTRFHVVLQPNSISEVSDFIDHLQVRRHF